jgi:type I restriction enzyme R subunit
LLEEYTWWIGTDIGYRYIRNLRGITELLSKTILNHQLDVVRRLLADAGAEGAGKRYLIQHSAGSGKSNSIAWLAHAERSGDLREFIESGKKIIITTVQKFPFILDEIGNEQRGRHFAIIIDEAHSSQGGRTAAAMSQALSGAGAEAEDETFEDKINRLMEAHKLLPNASYLAFTATPKNKTLEMFGEPAPQADGTVKHWPSTATR